MRHVMLGLTPRLGVVCQRRLHGFRNALALVFAVLSLLPSPAHGKVTSGHIRISGAKAENHWKYVSKFGYTTGRGSFQLRVKPWQPKTLGTDAVIQMSVYLDEDWPRVESSAFCDRPALARQVQTITVLANGSWSEWRTGTLHQSVRPHIWYFAVSDCNHTLQNFTHRMRWEFQAQQDGGSQFSVEQSWMLTVNVLCLLGFSAYNWVFLKRSLKFGKSAGSVHPVIWTLSVAIFVQYLAQVLHTIHLWRYSYDGAGYKPLEVFSEVLFMLAQVSQTSLLILIALGYTLLQSKIGELDLMIPLCFMIGVIHVMLVGFGKIQDDASYKYHENEGVVGWILLIMRLLLFVWFLWAVNSCADEGGARLANFLRKFRAAGSVYFLAYPAIFLSTKLFAPYLQHMVMTTGLIAMQMGSNIWLGTLFLTRGEYFKVSTLSSSDLPGGVKIGVVKEE